ncbi:hypothetical protein [Lelliottia amnigena]|uniref:hypothetical protein n=1 Tax=Lelliottia amnigena TaxID=61646 RepID=UPI00293BBE95|nr:hypothetical protein [Lelliottia amnigena]
MTTINKPMTGEQLDELMTIAVNMQRDSEKIGERSVAMFAYAVQVAVLEIHDVRSQLAESQSKLEKMAAENAGLKKYICDECYVENIKTGAAKCAGLGMPETPATDAFLAEVRASGVEALVLRRKTAARIARDRDDLRAADALEGEASRAQMFANEIRQEAK